MRVELSRVKKEVGKMDAHAVNVESAARAAVAEEVESQRRQTAELREQLVAVRQELAHSRAELEKAEQSIEKVKAHSSLQVNIV